MLDRVLLKNIALTYSSRLVLIALGLICNVFITRSLGVENYGSYVLFITLIATIVQVSNFGIPASNLYLAAKNENNSSLLASNSFIYSFIAACICGIFYTFNFFDVTIENISPLYFSVTVFFILFVLLGKNILIGLGEIGKDNINNIIARVLVTIYLSAYFVAGELSFDVAVDSYIIFSIILFILVGYSLYKEGGTLIKPSVRFFFENVSFNIKSYITNLFSFLVFKIDIFIISYFLTKLDVGLYSFSVSFIDYIYLLPVVISTVIFQKYASISSLIERKVLHKKACALFFFFYFIFITIVYLTLEYMVVYLFGEQYVSAIDYIKILLIAIYVMGCSTMIQQFLVSSGFPKILVYLWGIGLLINIVANFTFIPIYGVYAAAYSTLIVYLFIFLSGLVLIKTYKFSE